MLILVLLALLLPGLVGSHFSFTYKLKLIIIILLLLLVFLFSLHLPHLFCCICCLSSFCCHSSSLPRFFSSPSSLLHHVYTNSDIWPPLRSPPPRLPLPRGLPFLHPPHFCSTYKLILMFLLHIPLLFSFLLFTAPNRFFHILSVAIRIN